MSSYVNFSEIPALPVALDYDPIREPQKRNGKTIPGAFWTINSQTDEVIGSGRSKHRPTNFTQMWENFRYGVNESNVDTSNIKVKFRHSQNGSAFFADIVFKEYDYAPIVGEPTHMKMRIGDSHDQTLKRTVKCYMERLFCSNGCSSIAENLTFSEKHTKMSDPEAIGEVVGIFPSRLEKEAEIYASLQDIPFTKNQALTFFRTNVCTYVTRTGRKVNDTMLNECMRIWGSYSGMGRNVFRLYNVLTHIGTHVTASRGGDLTRKAFKMENEIGAIIKGEAFQELALAA